MSLVVVSRRITAEELGITKFTDLLGSNTSCFIKDGVGLIGWGEAQRLSATGASRFEDLDNSWKEVVESAEISDQVNLEGSGLIAFGAMAFSANSQIESCLVVPKLVIGSTNGEYFITTVNTDETQAKALIQNLTETQKLSFVSGKISAEDFSRNVADAIKLISSGLVSKIVLARDLVSEASNFNPNIGLRKLSEKFSSCYTYLVDGMFGTSPELLVKVTNREVSARVLAGTAGRGTDVEVDRAIGDALSHSHKNLAEHKFAIDSLTQAMQELCSEIRVSEEPFSLSLPNLWHLASDVTAMLSDDSTSLKLLQALHPSAAVAGTPREKALELIESIEGIDRGRYAGPVGWVSASGDGVWAIALRGAQHRNNQVVAFAGCGIVSESEPESELAETDLKFKAVLENF